MQSTVQRVLKELRSTLSKGWRPARIASFPGRSHLQYLIAYSTAWERGYCQNTFKDKPTFIKRLIKVLVAKNVF